MTLKGYSNLHYKHAVVDKLTSIGAVRENQIRTALKIAQIRHPLIIRYEDTTRPHFATSDFTLWIGKKEILIEAKRFKNKFNLYDWRYVGAPRFNNRKGLKALIHSGISKPLEKLFMKRDTHVRDLYIPYDASHHEAVGTILSWIEELITLFWGEKPYVSPMNKPSNQTLTMPLKGHPPGG